MSRLSAEDTIVAVATPPGRGALAIVRVSGAQALEIARPMIEPWPHAPRHAALARIRDSSGALLDEGIVVYYHAPASFTGEHTVEVTCHGGPVSSALIVAAVVSAGARPAEPGEFTRRAVMSGRLDLLQAEAVGDLIDAPSRSAQRVALSQLDGGLSRRIDALREHILALEALAAYDIDFPEEDDGPVSTATILGTATDLVREVDQLLATAPIGEVVRAGAVVVIAGAPNVGKSSLFNALLGRRRAIVTDIPGTTRDAIEALIETDGWPVRLIDTAGLHDATDVVERLGVEVSREYVEKADVVLACGDNDALIGEAERATQSLTRAVIVRVRTKADLLREPSRSPADGALRVSAETGEGLAELGHAIARALETSRGRLSLDAPLVTRERHRFALQRARAELEQFCDAWTGQSLPAVVAAVHLRDATRALEEIIGTVDIEDVLDRVFASFCVGK